MRRTSVGTLARREAVIDLVFTRLLAAARAHLDGGPAQGRGLGGRGCGGSVAALNESGCPSGVNQLPCALAGPQRTPSQPCAEAGWTMRRTESWDVGPL
jgi:hypothetical protein